ncbi:thiamine diphosphokinase [Thermoactinomyces sp. CICC 10522]|jgi:thiamine pyrophosphokinase|uniref:thiamine diphosphokinase n=1 Tax=Thermoactinomyces sp. CICC 10522 TaxID=2767427 RepID=UPI0018DCEF78|nr:thiamine diphosphokinase [Thermoactinomyces sp. CICC 10522]MBH8598127.1 thiamine diphosphokinase [Thermoactinomyces sp. CICC 10523]MBH8603158.1 thiamine diphosphokinase [Thermoactinomyces sp. CICC 10522]
MLKQKVLVVAGGDLTAEEIALIDPEKYYIITADAGAKKLVQAGITPHLAVGDFDTAGEEFADELMQSGIEVERLPAEKEETDLHYALTKALEHQTGGEVLILGALGGARLDHLLANVGLLEWLEARGTRGVLLHSSNRVRFFSGPGKIELRQGEFPYISLIPVSREVTGIVTDGLKYPLKNETLYRGFTRGISNELASGSGWVSIRSGKCLLVESRDR